MKVAEIYSSRDYVLVTGVIMEQGEITKIVHGSLSSSGDLIIDTLNNNRTLLHKRYRQISNRDPLIQTFIATSHKTIHNQIKALTETRIREVMRNAHIVRPSN